MWKQVFCFLEVVLFYSEFFPTSGILLFKWGGGQFLQTNQIPVSGRRFFRIFQRFFKVEAAFQYSKNVFSTNPLSG